MNSIVNSTGSPAAEQFGKQMQASDQAMFKQQNQNLAAKESAMGITSSGAAKADFTDLAAQQSGVLAGQVAPLYLDALNQYGNIAGQGAAAESGGYNSAHQAALDQFYKSLNSAAAAGAAGGG